MKRSVAVIFHEQEKKIARRFVISPLADIWKKDGIEVTFVFGTKVVVPADLAILHVDLSRVPEEYLEYARQYPLTLNGTVADIRKSTFSTHIVRRGDGYGGKVIVKSDLNHAGLPERNLSRPAVFILLHRLMKKIPRARLPAGTSPPLFDSPFDYRVLDSPEHVPQEWYDREDIVIEQFLPEIDQGRYCIRNYHFLGDRHVCVRRSGMHPVVNASSVTGTEPATVHPEIVAFREKMQFDYGKFDYVMHGERPVLLDINKTPGTAPAAQVIPSLRREWAAGIHAYFSGSG